MIYHAQKCVRIKVFVKPQIVGKIYVNKLSSVLLLKTFVLFFSFWMKLRHNIKYTYSYKIQCFYAGKKEENCK